MKRYLLLGLLTSVFLQLRAQEISISGTVTSSEEDDAIPSVNVIVKDTEIGTTTNADGEYSLIVPTDQNILIFSFIGYLTTEVAIDNQSNINVQLTPDIRTLSEVVVVGYGEQKRKTLTGSISTVSNEDIKDLPSPSPDQLLHGRVSGVQVVSNSGEPGGGILVRIRGSTSISGSSDPLYIVDGIPVASGDLSQIVAGSGTNALAALNPADIQSIEVLKDASATAIYGARAANGVVLITTKRGSNAKPVININSYYGVSHAWKSPDDLRVDGPTFERLQNEASRNNWIDQYGTIDALGANGNAYVQPYSNPGEAINTNWLDKIFRTASLHNIDVSVRGGNERVKYFLSGADYRQEGIIKPTAFGRRSGRLNLDFLAADQLKIGTSIMYAATSRNRLSNGNDVSGALTTAFFYPSNEPVYNEDGSYNKPLWENPVAAINETEYLMTTDRLIGNVFAEYEIVNRLMFRTSWGIDHNLVDEYRYFNTKLNAGTAVNGLGISVMTQDRTWIGENTLSYQLDVNRHSFDALLGNTVQENSLSINQVSGQQFPSDAFRQLSSAAVINYASTSVTLYGLLSFFGRVNYAFQEKYLATVNLRADASSRFGADHRWGIFPAVAVGWLLSEEKWMESFEAISNLKLRASYGMTGNQNGINNFQSLGLWGGQRGGLNGGGGTAPINEIGSAAAYVNEPGFTPNQLENPDLKWETTVQLDIGIDVGMLQDRLSFTFDYYNKQTQDLLLAVPVPRSTGYNELVQNYGAMENKGWELSINATPVISPHFNWSVSFNTSHNQNKIKKIAAPFTVFTRDFIRVEEGYPLSSFWVHEQLGVDPQTGNSIWNTGDDDVFDPNVDRFIIGSAQPDYFGGLTNTINFHNFDFTCFFQYSYGNDILNYNRYFFEHGGERTTGYMSTQLDRWQKPGDITDVPRMAKQNYSTALRPSRLIEDGSYLRLKNLTLGYTLPTNWSNKIAMSKLRVYVSAQNLLTFTQYSGLDPEVSVDASELVGGIDFAVMPQPRTVMGGININF